MDVAGFARQFKCSENADEGNWINEIEEVHFHLRLDLLHHPGNIDRHCFIVESGAISKAIGTVIKRLTEVSFHGLKNRQRFFGRLD